MRVVFYFFFPALRGMHQGGEPARQGGEPARSLGETINHGFGESIAHGLVFLGVSIAVGFIGAAIITKM